MGKNKRKNVDSPKTLKKSARRTQLWLAICGVSLSLLGAALLFFLGNDKGDKEADAAKTAVVIKTKEDADKYLRENSNYSADALKELDFNSYWPKEYFTINIKDKKISYWKDTVDVEVKYNDCTVTYAQGKTSGNHLKRFKDNSAKDAFENFPTDLGKELEGLVEEKYRYAIDEAFKDNRIDEAERNLSILYNALAGHPGSYIVLGRANEKSEWKYYQPTDFPTHIMPSNKDLIALASMHVKDTAAKATPLGESLMELVDSISVKAISFDYRGDKIWYGDESAKAEKKDIPNLKEPYSYTILYGNSACGWIVPAGKENLKDAKEFYCNRRFIDEKTYNALNNFKWNERKVEPPTPKWIVATKKFFYYVGLCFFPIGVLLLIVAALPFVVKFLRKRSAKPATADADDADDNGNDGDDEKESHEDDKKILFEIVGGESTEELQEKIERLKEEVDRLKKEVKRKGNDSFSKETIEKAAVEEFKKSKEFKEYIADTRADAVSDFKKSKEFKEYIADTRADAVSDFKKNKEYKECIADAKADAVREFMQSVQYKNLDIEARNWRDLTSCTSEEKVITFLDKTHKVIPSFPKLNTLSNIYAEAKAAGKNETELVAVILAALEKQTGKTGLPTMYNELVANAEYGVDVRERFESCKTIAQRYGERREYMQIVSQGTNLSIWERLAVMLWATECTNEVLKVFGKGNFAVDVVKHAAETHKDDIMQIFATRIFNKYIADQSVTTGALTGLREKMMADKLAEVQSKYGISMSASQAYRDFVESLDSTHDKLKANVAFINMMKAQLVDEFMRSEREITDKGVYMSYVVAMGLHMCDYIRYMSGNGIDYCPNLKFVLSGLMPAALDSSTEFRHKDPAYSGEYSNRIYEWLKESGVTKLKALVGNKYIMP